MLITQAKVRDQSGLVDIDIDGEVITRIAPSDGSRQGDYDAHGRLVIPQFVEAHIHLDYAHTAGTPRVNESGTLFEAIEIWQERKNLGLNTIEQTYADALSAAKELASHGVGHVRTHVDVTDPNLHAFEALMRLKEDVSDWMDIQIVAFPQNGIYAFDEGDKLVEQAVHEGADVIGAIPHLEPTRTLGEQSLQFVFDLAERTGTPVDVHCDEIDDPHSRFIDNVTAQAQTRSMGTQTVISHAVAMAYYSPGYLSRLLPKLVNAGVNFAVCPNENLHLQGRGGMVPIPRGVAPVKQLKDTGLNVAFCQDSMQDPWYPMGSGNLLRIVDSGLHVGHMLAEPYLSESLDFVTVNPARNLQITDYGVSEGNRANLVVLDATSDHEAVRTDAPVLLSVHKGKTVFRMDPPTRQWEITSI